MNRGPFLFLGVLFTLASSFWGLVLLPQVKLGRQEMVEIKGTGALYPATRTGLARQGAEVYRSLGCVECHTQQVRPRGFGTDFERGWGQRFTVAQDYLRDYPVLLGNLRIGPDLANIGARQTNANYHLAHLYDPQSTAKGSMMPPYRFLFEERKLAPGEAPSPAAVSFEGTAGPAGLEVVPTEEARALVAYLLSLQATVPLFESPLPAPATNANATATATNAPDAAATNAASTNPPGAPAK